MRIFPKEIDFFEIFDKAASNLTKATSLLVSLMENFDNLEARAKDLHRTTEVLQKTIKELRAKNYSHVQEHCIEINRLENRIDRTFRDALGKLFDDIKDPLLIIKWKEIYEHLEDASDRCEDVANVLEGIVLKNA